MLARERISRQRNEVPGLVYPFEGVPAPGTSMEVAPGIRWVRMPLPFSLDHINLWLLEDGDGWAIVDTGLRGRHVKQSWEQIFAADLGGRPVTRIFVTHYHPDHIGQAGWLTQRWQAPLCMSRTDFLFAKMLSLDVRDEPPAEAVEFYRRCGYDETQLAAYKARGYGGFAKGVTTLPIQYERLQDGDVLAIGGREWRVMVGRGHAPEHVCLFSPEIDVLISGDQVLPRISSNVSVMPTEPEANPLEDWLTSLRAFRAALPEDVLVLPAHNEPFRGAHRRLDRLVEGHENRLDDLLDRCDEPRRAVDVFSVLYKRRIDLSEIGLATGEALAHLHCLAGRGLLVRETDSAGIRWWRRAGSAEAAEAA
jgi:glyoxylase-like metal-dependent hydrolase (beta-lactamase superfamily II)